MRRAFNKSVMPNTASFSFPGSSSSSASFPRPGSRSLGKTGSRGPMGWWMVLLVVSLASFYAGINVGWHSGAATTKAATLISASAAQAGTAKAAAAAAADKIASAEAVAAAAEEKHRELEFLQTQVEQKLKETEEKLAACRRENEAKKKTSKPTSKPTETKTKTSDDHQTSDCKTEAFRADAFPKDHTGSFASGMEFVDRIEFAETYDTGVPLDENRSGNDQVLILYSDKSAFPDKVNTSSSSKPLSVEDATANCHNLHVLLTQAPDRKHQCIAIMGQYESYHLQKFMRVDQNITRGGVDPSLPLTYVSRGYQQNGRKSAKVPTIEHSRTHWESLVPYLQSLDEALEGLGPILKKVASHNDHNAIIVMVCNFGHSELLLNFICNARAKGFGHILDNILLFATDQETQDLAESMGITSVFLESIFGSMPSDAAKRYADKTFKRMMAAKVYCVQMVSMLGYDILFQDVDVVWYKNPLEWFHDSSSDHYHFDMYFQDDGNHGLFYAPYSANTGFYYVRNNPRTQFFFNSLLMTGDLILSTSSHQIALVSLLNEHASMYGLRVKIWERNKHEFPGGYTYHRMAAKKFLKSLMAGEEDDTYVFHMSWTASKKDKLKFFQQMGEWYLEDKCIGTKLNALAIDSGGQGKTTSSECCAADATVTCHYRDKPSKIPCKDSPPIDKGARSFW
mmetsp:Transcript_5502/g.15925  ORF Transcript_5502/g.15925 Transcript_5502/m.15925 type:complete len:682 (-) Transcript_5502:710-2755(-)|eukprot:CAMPEP_0172381650 /NCGR_PEP_ID=MMETSP1060-20121228/71060_1 /TAXON_ID=37318 /ORGANISM="Pseudo-nitzschia pungens, Strain cf. cingulata" /LENGTH=681 /DNA_ID=CAMNT_0013109437 /DNA_START=165 /DNA_END=2210 /DNA_ORIENTATION=+